jgi:hypothetical protein
VARLTLVDVAIRALGTVPAAHAISTTHGPAPGPRAPIFRGHVSGGIGRLSSPESVGFISPRNELVHNPPVPPDLASGSERIRLLGILEPLGRREHGPAAPAESRFRHPLAARAFVSGGVVSWSDRERLTNSSGQSRRTHARPPARVLTTDLGPSK